MLVFLCKQDCVLDGVCVKGSLLCNSDDGVYRTLHVHTPNVQHRWWRPCRLIIVYNANIIIRCQRKAACGRCTNCYMGMHVHHIRKGLCACSCCSVLIKISNLKLVNAY